MFLNKNIVRERDRERERERERVPVELRGNQREDPYPISCLEGPI
jgi:hypothetical protein